MSGNYKPRDKTDKEKAYDLSELEKETLGCAEAFSTFFTEFVELDGDIFFSTYNKASNAVAAFERAKRFLEMPKVGKEWDWEKGIIGVYRYNDI